MTNATTINLTNGVPTGPAGAATVSSLDNMLGTAGSPSANVQTVQGVSGGTALPVTAASGALADGAVATIGTKADGAVTNPAASASLIAALKGLMSALCFVAGGTAATVSKLVGGIYNSSYPSLTNGQQAALQLDKAGGLANVGNRPFVVKGTINNGQTTYGNSGVGICVGGLVTVSTGLPPGTIVTALTFRVKVLTSNITTTQQVVWKFFDANPTSSTYTDGAQESIAAADLGKHILVTTVAISANPQANTVVQWTDVTGLRLAVDSSGNFYFAFINTQGNLVFTATDVIAYEADGTY
jgi:hypothetical protein